MFSSSRDQIVAVWMVLMSVAPGGKEGQGVEGVGPWNIVV